MRPRRVTDHRQPSAGDGHDDSGPRTPGCGANYFSVAMKPPAQLRKSLKMILSDIDKEIKKKWKPHAANLLPASRLKCSSALEKKKKKKKYVVDTGLYTLFPGSQANVNVCVSSTNCSRFRKMFGLARVSVPSNILFSSL